MNSYKLHFLFIRPWETEKGGGKLWRFSPLIFLETHTCLSSIWRCDDKTFWHNHPTLTAFQQQDAPISHVLSPILSLKRHVFKDPVKVWHFYFILFASLLILNSTSLFRPVRVCCAVALSRLVITHQWSEFLQKTVGVEC